MLINGINNLFKSFVCFNGESSKSVKFQKPKFGGVNMVQRRVKITSRPDEKVEGKRRKVVIHVFDTGT